MADKTFKNGFDIKKEMLIKSQKISKKNYPHLFSKQYTINSGKRALSSGFQEELILQLLPLCPLMHWVRSGYMALSSRKRSRLLPAGNWG